MDLDLVSLVGALLGAGQALLWFGLDGLSDPTRAIIVVGAGVLITGGFHEDGLSRLCRRTWWRLRS